MQELYRPDGGSRTYPPSILMIGNSPSTLQLKQRLENKSCRVCHMGLDSENLAPVRRLHFDVIVLNLERPDANEAAIYKKLKMNPELAHIPVVVLSIPDRIEIGKALNGSKVYYLPRFQRNAGIADVEAGLLRIIEQIHYLTYRYM